LGQEERTERKEGRTLEKGGKRENLACDRKKRTERSREGRRPNKKGRDGTWLAKRGKGKRDRR
jgi:hypothetical protein